MRKKSDPDMTSVFRDSTSRALDRANCVKIGSVESFDTEEQKAEIALLSKYERPETGELIDYPLLVDVPVMVLQGGGAYIEMPIAAGDTCLVLFNDYNIDTWWTTGNVTPPATRRKHSLADGIAIVGINAQGSGVGATGDGSVRLINEGGFIDVNGDSKRFVTYAELDSALQTFISALNSHTHTSGGSGSPTTPPISPLSLDISAAESTKVRTG